MPQTHHFFRISLRFWDAQATSLGVLWSTTYGRALILKLFVAAPMLGFGGIHFLFTTPIMKRAATQPGGSPCG
jgi:putative copper export protein